MDSDIFMLKQPLGNFGKVSPVDRIYLDLANGFVKLHMFGCFQHECSCSLWESMTIDLGPQNSAPVSAHKIMLMEMCTEVSTYVRKHNNFKKGL